MPEYKAVPGGHAISKKIADLLEDINSQLYNGMNRAETIREINDILHGRSDTSVDMLLSMLNEQGGSECAERIGELRGQIEAFFLQKVLRSWPYTRIGNQEYQYKTWDFLTDRPLKVIDQRIFDHAVENGFPPDFFKETVSWVSRAILPAGNRNRIVSFDLYEMGEQLKPTALNVTMETIQNRVAANRLAGKYTWVFLDEIYLFFKYYYSAQFLYKCWKRFRKYGAAMTGATQNVEECLRSDTARLMFANSEFLVLLNQAATDRAELARLLNISETQMGHVTGAEAGHGLLRIGGSIVPFANEFPRSGELYRLWSTTPGDK